MQVPTMRTKEASLHRLVNRELDACLDRCSIFFVAFLQDALQFTHARIGSATPLVTPKM